MAIDAYVVMVDCQGIRDGGTLRERMAAARDRGARALVLDVRTPLEMAPVSPALFREIAHFPLPVVAACTGEPGGASMVPALVADIRICDAATAFHCEGLQPHERQRLCRITGKEADTGVLSAGEALTTGLVTAVTGRGGALVEARRVAGVIASRGPLATQLGKEAVWRGLEISFHQALRFETDLTLLLQTTKDRAEGVAAFMEKRQPVFRGD